MILYHGSREPGIRVLEPRQADHDRPYIYLTTIDVVAAFYLCNAVERPYYWFPYGFRSGEPNIPVYDELYPNALREVSEGVQGWIYTVEVSEADVLPFGSNPSARLSVKPLNVTGCIEVPDAYALFQEYIQQGKMSVGRYENMTQKHLDFYYQMILAYMLRKHLPPDSSYARFVREKFPAVWERFLIESSNKN